MTTFQGDGTSDEMCLGFLTFYPAENAVKSDCVAYKDVSFTKLMPPFRDSFDTIGGCRYKEFMNASFPATQVLVVSFLLSFKHFRRCWYMYNCLHAARV